jgi:hypothetical protein
MAAANDPSPPTPPTAGENTGQIQAAPPAGSTDVQTAPSAAPTDIQAPPPPAEPPIRLSPRPQPAYLLQEQAQGVARLNQALVAVVLVLAFLLASFPVRNADFWSHLACGRDFVNGTYNPFRGQEPFSYAGSSYWVNHAWLFDVVLFQLYQLLGGPLLVALKALLVVGVAWALLQVRRPGQDLWLPAVGTGLALLALTPRLQVQPMLLSFLFLAVTLWLLQRSEAEGGGRVNTLWLLPPLFVLWVNLDSWFVLGLAAVALYVVGEAMQGRVFLPGAEAGAAPPVTEDARVRRLALVLAVSVAACLVNPYTFHAFSLPAAISPGQPTSLLRNEDLGKLFASPFAEDYWSEARLGGSIAGLTFFPLVLVGVASFGVAWPNWRWWRVLLWLLFFLLAAWRWQAVPFFALVAGPIAALNFADFAARPERRPLSPVLPAAVLVAGGLLLLLAWSKLDLSAQYVAIVGGLVAAPRVVWWFVVVNSRGGQSAPAPDADPSGSRSWVAAVRIAVVLAVLLVALHLGTQTPFYTDKLSGVLGPPVPSLFLVFAGFVVGAYAFGIVPTLAYFDRVFLDWSLGGRVLTLQAGIGLLVAAWPGWLGASYQDPSASRRVAWAVEPDPSLTGVAERLCDLRKKGLIKDTDHGLALTIQQGSYCAWLCPGEKTFFDQRFELFPEAAGRYIEVREAVLSAAKAGSTPTEEGAAPRGLGEVWKETLEPLGELFREQKINHLVLHAESTTEPSVQLLARMKPLLSDGKQWRLVYLDGRSAIFGWRDPEDKGATDPWASEAYSTARRAFGPETKEPVPEAAPPDPPAVPDWTRYTTGPGPRPLQADEAALHLQRFEERAPDEMRQTYLAFRGRLGAGWVGAAVPAGGPVSTAQRLAFRLAVEGTFFPKDPNAPLQEGSNRLVDRLANLELGDFVSAQDKGPPAYPLLAIRAARRAVAVNPRDPQAYLWLQAGYFTLRYDTRERRWCLDLPELDTLRHVQMITALQHALTVQPDQPETHALLAELYGRYSNPRNGNNGYLDLQLKHLEELLRLLKRAGPQPSETEEEFKRRVEPVEKQVKELQKVVRERQDRYEVGAANKEVLAKAEDALSKGLAEQALTVLLDSGVLEFGQRGAQLELLLLLTMGRVEQARKTLHDPDTDMKAGLGDAMIGPRLAVPAFQWFDLLLSAAEGDYRTADEQFPALLEAQDSQLQQVTARMLGFLAGPLRETLEAIQAAGGRERVLSFLAGPIRDGLADPPQEWPLAYLALRKVRRDLALAALVAQMQEERTPHPAVFRPNKAELTVLRGLLALEAGDPGRAKQAFEAAEKLTPFDFPGRAAADRYLQLMNDAAGRK